jgi:hypothetical protein
MATPPIQQSTSHEPFRLQVEVDLSPTATSSGELGELVRSLVDEPGNAVPTRVKLVLKVTLTNLSAAPFPGCVLGRMYLDAETYNQPIAESTAVPAIAGGGTIELSPSELAIPVGGLTWFKIDGPAPVDGRPVHLLRSPNDVWTGDLGLGFFALELDAGLQTVLLRRILATLEQLVRKSGP